MKNLLSRTLLVFKKSIRLKLINRKLDKYSKLQLKTQQQLYVINYLLDEYEVLYGESLRTN